MIHSLNERLRKVSKDSQLYEDEYEAIWIEDCSGPRPKAIRLGTVKDAERFFARLESARRRSTN
jgi:hypothetical protein